MTEVWHWFCLDFNFLFQTQPSRNGYLYLSWMGHIEGTSKSRADIQQLVKRETENDKELYFSIAGYSFLTHKIDYLKKKNSSRSEHYVNAWVGPAVMQQIV